MTDYKLLPDPSQHTALPGMAFMPAVTLLVRFGRRQCEIGVDYRGVRFWRPATSITEARDFVARNFPDFLETFDKSIKLTIEHDAKSDELLKNKKAEPDKRPVPYYPPGAREFAPPGKEVEYDVWVVSDPSRRTVVRARTFYFACQEGAAKLQASPQELNARIIK